MKKNYFFRLALLLFAVTLGHSVKAQDNPEIEGEEPTLDAQFENDGEGTYFIYSIEDWNRLAAWVADGLSTEGATFKLESDLPAEGDDATAIETTIGCQLTASDANSRRRFAGTFDGGIYNDNGELTGFHSINVNLTSAETNPNYTAPFAYTYDATIKNLKVTGDISTTGTFAGGLVGSTGPGTYDGKVTIENVEVAVNMNCNYLSGDQGSGKYANQAGFVGIAENGATITNCVFSGKLTGADFAYSGGFIGLDKGKDDNLTKLTNCFFVPSEVNAANLFGSSEFVHKDSKGAVATLTDCYYTVSFSEPETAQGVKVVTSYNEGDDVTPVTGPNGVTYYIVKHYKTWLDVQEGLAGNDQTITLANDITAGTEDTPLVVAAGRNVTLNLNGYTLDRALDIVAARNDGYVIKVEAGGYLTIYDGTIRGGHNTGNGGGIYNAGTLNLDGVTVTGNYASKGAGVYHVGNENQPLCVLGNVQINGNHNDNVYLANPGNDGGVIFVSGSLDENASIGVTSANGTGTITANLVNNGTILNFFSDNPNYFVDITTGDYPDAFLSDEEIAPLTLVNDATNTANTNAELIASYNGKRTDVTLSGRTFTSGVWNTLCLPFDVTLTTLKANTALGGNITVHVLEEASVDNQGTLTLTFAPMVNPNTTIKAGTPFLVKGAKGNPTFSGVTVKNVHNDVVGTGITFKGTYDRVNFTNGDKSILFLSKNNLYYPGQDNYVNAMRAYFVINTQSTIKAYVMDFGDGDDATAIMTIDNGQLTTEGAIYNLAGQRLQKMQKGINIVNGKKILF